MTRASGARSGAARFAVIGLLLSAGPALAEAPVALQAQDLNGHSLAVPSGLPTPRTLLLVGFRHADHDALQRWREGLALSDTDPAWLETPIIGVKNGMVRSMILTGMRSGAKTPQARAKLAPVFADGASVAAQLGLDPARPAAVVLDHAGHVLARASGDYDAAKGRLLLAALRTP